MRDLGKVLAGVAAAAKAVRAGVWTWDMAEGLRARGYDIAKAGPLLEALDAAIAGAAADLDALGRECSENCCYCGKPCIGLTLGPVHVGCCASNATVQRILPEAAFADELVRLTRLNTVPADRLRDLVVESARANPRILADWREGKRAAAAALVGAVKRVERAADGKALLPLCEAVLAELAAENPG